MKRLFFLHIILFSAWICNAQNAAQWWQKGNAYYMQKQYDSAVVCYEHIAAQHPALPALYYNLGNTYYRLNKIAPAILNYERALHYDPSYKDAQENLTLTESRIPNRIQHTPQIFFLRWWHTLTNAHTASAWAVAALILFCVAIVLLITSRLSRIIIPSQIKGLLFSGCIICLILAYTASNNTANSGKAVVMENDAPLLYQQQGKTQSLVPEGTTVNIKGNPANGWYKVILPDGRSGWIKQGLLTKI